MFPLWLAIVILFFVWLLIMKTDTHLLLLDVLMLHYNIKIKIYQIRNCITSTIHWLATEHQDLFPGRSGRGDGRGRKYYDQVSHKILIKEAALKHSWPWSTVKIYILHCESKEHVQTKIIFYRSITFTLCNSLWYVLLCPILVSPLFF